MPSFSIDDIDIDVEEFYGSCSTKEREELINLFVKNIDDFYDLCDIKEKKELSEFLITEGYVKEINLNNHPSCYNHKEFLDNLDKIQDNYYKLSDEEIDLLKKISDRF